MKIQEVVADDIGELITWFPDANSLNRWGGPFFRHPFDATSFNEDLRWKEMASYCLKTNDDELLAFGQFYERYQRINLARLVVNPAYRGEGHGRHLINCLMKKSRKQIPLGEFSLFVYRDNRRAMACYQSMGFKPAVCPAESPLGDSVEYMICPVNPAG